MTTKDPREVLAEWKALAEGATEGPWEWYPDTSEVIGKRGGVLETTWHHDEDGPFAAAARTAVPALVKAVEAALATLDKIDRLAREGDDPISASADYWQGARNAHDYLSGSIRSAITDALTEED